MDTSVAIRAGFMIFVKAARVTMRKPQLRISTGMNLETLSGKSWTTFLYTKLNLGQLSAQEWYLSSFSQ